MLAEKAGLILRPAGDAQHVFAPQHGRESVKLGNCRAGVHHVATLEGRASPGQDCIRPLPDRGGLRFSYTVPCAAASWRGSVCVISTCADWAARSRGRTTPK